MLKTTLAVLLLALPAGAATLSITSDLPSYQAGDIIVLTITGDAEGATGYGIFGRITYSEVLTDTLGAAQTAFSDSGQTWVTGTLQYADGDTWVFNQIAGLESLSSDVPLVSTVQLRAVYGGTLTVTWGDDLDFFGIPSGPGLAFPIAGDPPPPPVVEEPPPVVEAPPSEVYPPYVPPNDPISPAGSPAPEPSGGLIFGLGLVLAAIGRDRKRHSDREGSAPLS